MMIMVAGVRVEGDDEFLILASYAGAPHAWWPVGADSLLGRKCPAWTGPCRLRRWAGRRSRPVSIPRGIPPLRSGARNHCRGCGACAERRRRSDRTVLRAGDRGKSLWRGEPYFSQNTATTAPLSRSAIAPALSVAAGSGVSSPPPRNAPIASATISACGGRERNAGDPHRLVGDRRNDSGETALAVEGGAAAGAFFERGGDRWMCRLAGQRGGIGCDPVTRRAQHDEIGLQRPEVEAARPSRRNRPRGSRGPWPSQSARTAPVCRRCWLSDSRPASAPSAPVLARSPAPSPRESGRAEARPRSKRAASRSEARSPAPALGKPRKNWRPRGRPGRVAPPQPPDRRR